LKAPILILLSLSLLAPRSYTIEPMQSRSPSVNEYGIDLEESYPGTQVTELLRASEDEAVTAVKAAFEEGYKEGRIDGAAIWLPLYDGAVERAKKAEKRPTLKSLLVSVAAAFTLGAITSGAVAWGTR